MKASILVIAPSWVGDAVLAQPLFKRLHERHRELTLDVLAPPWTCALFARMPEIHAAIESPFGHGELALRRRYALGRSLAPRRYSQAIVLPNSFKSALIPFFAAIPRRTGFVGEARWGLLNDARRLEPQALPLMAERFALLAENAGDPVKRPLAAARLSVDDAQRRATLAKLGLALRRPVAVLCPGAEYGPAKRWPPNYFAELARMLSLAGLDVWLAGSANDAAIGDEIVSMSGNSCINVRSARCQQRFRSDARCGCARQTADRDLWLEQPGIYAAAFGACAHRQARSAVQPMFRTRLPARPFQLHAAAYAGAYPETNRFF